jgi:hypothetical protein
MLDDLAWHGSAVRGQRGDERDQLDRDARRALRRHRLRPLSGFTGSVGAGRGGVARHVAEPGMPEQVVPVGMGGEPGDHRNAEPVQVIRELGQLGTVDAGIDQDQPILPAHHDGIGPDPLTLPDPDAVGHFSQHRFTLSSISPGVRGRARSHSLRVIVAAHAPFENGGLYAVLFWSRERWVASIPARLSLPTVLTRRLAVSGTYCQECLSPR